MTSSTKSPLVEYIIPLYIKAHEEWLNNRDDRDFWEIAVPLVAIATLQYARDNVSNEMVDTGMSVDLADGNAGEDIETRVSDVFRAMIDALLKEIGGGE